VTALVVQLMRKRPDILNAVRRIGNPGLTIGTASVRREGGA
jgi:hypothetical protein